MNKLYLLFALGSSVTAKMAGDCKNSYALDFQYGVAMDECGDWCLDMLYGMEYVKAELEASGI